MYTSCSSTINSLRFAKLQMLFIAASFFGCQVSRENDSQQNILLFKDKDGLYLYDWVKQKDSIIFKADKEQIFLDEPCEFSGDTLQFGFRSEYHYPEEKSTFIGETYYKTYYSLGLKSGRSWVSKKVFYETGENNILHITTELVAPDGTSISLHDSLVKVTSLSHTYKGVTFNPDKPRFFSESTVGDKSVYSLEGNIYLVDKADTTILIKFDGHFDPKFGGGYYQPRLHPKADYALVTYLPSLTSLAWASLKKVDLKTKEVFAFSDGYYSDISFSDDGNFFLFKRNERKGINDIWLSNICIYDLTTGTEYKIGEAYAAQWIK